MYLKIHNVQGKTIAAACDSGLLGKKLAQGHILLDLEKHRSFYEGKKIRGSRELVLAIRQADSANLVGEKCVGAAIGAGLAPEGQAISISGVLHLQIYKFSL